MKKILVLSTSDFGGVGLYNKGLVEALYKCGFDVQMVVAKKKSESHLITAVKMSFWQKIVNKLSRYVPFTKRFYAERVKKNSNKDFYFFEPFEQSTLYSFKQILKCIKIKPDVVVACWTSGFLNFDLLGKIGKYFSASTYVYTADMSHFTGGCHYAWTCTGYFNSCIDCPALPFYAKQLAVDNLDKKKKAIKKYNIKALAFSEFTQNQVKQSSLFKNQEHIPSFQGLVATEYFYRNHEFNLRPNYMIPDDKIVVVLGALNLYERRKGFKELVNALNIIKIQKPELANKILLIAIGRETNIHCSVELRFLPFAKDMKILGDYYRLADIYANTSLEDSGPQMLLQAMACGAIPVSFDTGFGSELKNGVTGFKVPVGDVNLFAKALIDAAELSKIKRHQMLISFAEKINRDNSLSRLQHVFSSL